MSTLYWGALSDVGVPQDIEKVTRNTFPVQVDAPPAEKQDAPDLNEVETDPNPELGYTGHQLASSWHQPEKAPPPGPTATAEHNAIIDRQVATSGTAASREAAGQWGHGSAAFAVGIEPTPLEVQFGTDYFAADKYDINGQSDSDYGVQPLTTTDNESNAGAAATYGYNSRAAYASTVSKALYGQFLAGE